VSQLTVAQIYERWRHYGRSRAAHPTLWDGSLMLATIGPQTTSEGTTVRDFSGRRNHGTLTGATHLPTWSNQSYRGQSFRGLTLDGTEDYVNIPNTGLSPPSSYTLSLWVNVTAYDGNYCMWFGKWNENSNQREYAIAESTAGNIVFYHAATGSYGAGSAEVTYTRPSVGAWTHVCGVFTAGSEIRLYLNGLSVNSAATVSTSVTSGTASPAVGRSPRFGNLANCLSGSVSDARLYFRALTPAEIQLFRHPLAAYAVRLPEYFTFTSTPSAAKYWMWARQQSAQVIGGGIT
jgi:hypothetical protein